MRPPLLLLTALALWPLAAQAADSVESYVNKAVEALRTISYEARMRYQPNFSQGEIDQAHIIHVAPDLFRVTPLKEGRAGEAYYIENALELVWINAGLTTKMPLRRFGPNDLLTAKFMRDLTHVPGASILSGKVGEYDVWILRQDAVKGKPYTVTVGLDQRNYFPLFLLVNDGLGERRVYFEMEAIEYHRASEINDHWFTYDENRGQRVPAPANKEVAPGAVQQLTERQGSSLDLAASPPLEAPLYPALLPAGYVLEAISVLDYKQGQSEQDSAELVVYQLEIFGPQGDLLSVFQTQAEDGLLDPGSVYLQPNVGYVVKEKGEWLVAAFGQLSAEQLLMVINGLKANDEAMLQLLAETNARDLIYQQAVNVTE